MRLLFIILVLVLLGSNLSCGSKSTDHSSHAMSKDTGPNQVLYNQVMDIHDEVMPITEDLYNTTKRLKTELKETADAVIQAELESNIRYVDSVNNMMMDWMRKFKPMPDTTNEETVRDYYESELEKIKKVKEAILEAKEKFPNQSKNEQ